MAGTNLARLQVSSLELKRTERENDDPVRELKTTENGDPVQEVQQHAHLSEVRTEMRQLIQHGTSRGHSDSPPMSLTHQSVLLWGYKSESSEMLSAFS